jgi:adenylate kinase family enzyme
VRRGRVHILGASGSGTTSLARTLANAWSVPHADTDDYLWLPTNPPYTALRPVPERLALMEALFLPREAWVLSGALMGWGDRLMSHFDAIVFLTVEPPVRLARLQAREQARYAGRTPSADEGAQYQAFLKWAKGYDDPKSQGRSRVGDEEWLSAVPCPVLRLDSTRPVEDLASAIMDWWVPDLHPT